MTVRHGRESSSAANTGRCSSRYNTSPSRFRNMCHTESVWRMEWYSDTRRPNWYISPSMQFGCTCHSGPDRRACTRWDT